MKKETKEKTITCKVNEELTITLKNVTEVMGHDDSLPFNADLYIRNAKHKRSKLVARCWNDGWGGETNIDTILPEDRETVANTNDFLKNTYECPFVVAGKKYAIDMTLEFLVSIMAEFAIHRDINSIKLDYLKDVVRKNK